MYAKTLHSNASLTKPQVLMWTRDMKRAQELAWLVATEYAKLLMDLGEPMEGVAEWLQVNFESFFGSAFLRVCLPSC